MASYSDIVSGTKSDASGTKSDASGWSISNSDQPGMALVVSPLVGTNFVSWSLAIKTALEAKDKLGFIDGTIKEPTDEAEIKKWKPVDSMVKSWVRNSIEKNLAETFMFCRTSRELWKEIEERYGARSGPKFYQLQQDLAALRQGADSVTSYYNKTHRLWDELHRLRPTPRCSCGKCGCNFNKEMDQLEADTKLVQFLMGLNQPFEVIRSQILSLDPLPSANKAFAMVANVETEKEINSSFNGNQIEASAMLARGNFRNENFKKADDRKNEKLAKHCDHCQQNGHTRDGCFKLIGYPDWWKELKEQKKKNGKKGSTANLVAESPLDMPKDKGPIDYANVMAAIQGLTKIVKGKPEEQHVNFVNLGEFAGKTGKSEYDPLTNTHWIVDTGASSHMCFNKDLLINLKPLNKAIPVHLPDGSVQNVKHTGSVVIQGKDQKTKETLVEGRLRNNLYVLKHEHDNPCNNTNPFETVNSVGSENPNSSSSSKKVENSNSVIWHQRLGYAPIHVIKHIDAIDIKSESVLPEVCDICHYAKQHRVAFPTTGSRALDNF
ncbi:uncharacterized protein G2W53_012755 [Senna tora]|uniref:Retrotransposon Copia-like N-terminal domain-containing protein n=1 Tax=Senna tora TaxID=362788 RepID=A0A834WQ21_9FABA|nr:uncharacterized protein G2W53_012755 [Senna tora]